MTTMPDQKVVQITGLIVAGGLGTRMGNADKGLQIFRGMTMAQHVMQRLAPQVGSVLINANRNIDRYRALGVPVWPDEIGDHAGPLAGLHAGLSHCITDYLMMVPCDSPLLPHDLVARLYAEMQQTGTELAVAVTSSGVQPVFSLMRSAVLPQLTQYLQSGKRKMQEWTTTLATVEVHFDDDTAFSNINTLDELRKLDAN